MKHVGMSHSATSATRNEATQPLRPLKVIPFGLAIGTAIRASPGRYANGICCFAGHRPDPSAPGSATRYRPTGRSLYTKEFLYINRRV